MPTTTYTTNYSLAKIGYESSEIESPYRSDWDNTMDIVDNELHIDSQFRGEILSLSSGILKYTGSLFSVENILQQAISFESVKQPSLYYPVNQRMSGNLTTVSLNPGDIAFVPCISLDDPQTPTCDLTISLYATAGTSANVATALYSADGDRILNGSTQPISSGWNSWPFLGVPKIYRGERIFIAIGVNPSVGCTLMASHSGNCYSLGVNSSFVNICWYKATGSYGFPNKISDISYSKLAGPAPMAALRPAPMAA